MECFPRGEFKKEIEHALDHQMDSLQDDIDWLDKKLKDPNFEMTNEERKEVESYRKRIGKTQDDIYNMLEKIKRIPVCEPPSFLPY